MKELLQRVLDEYLDAYNSDLTDHPLAILIRRTLPEAIRALLIDKERYKVKGSSGSGNWTPTPWVAIFDILITETAQSGYYPVFLFTNDMSGFYLSLNQGVTELREKYKKDATQILRLKAEDFRSQLDAIPTPFNARDILLNRNALTNSHLSKFYEAGNIISKFYSSDSLPSDDEVFSDIRQILAVYEFLSYNEGLPSVPAEKEEDEEQYTGYEELRKFRMHKRIERNQKLAKKVKEIQGYS